MVQRVAMLRRAAAFWACTGVRTMNFGYLAGEAVGFIASGRRREARAHGMRFAASHWQQLRISASGVRVSSHSLTGRLCVEGNIARVCGMVLAPAGKVGFMLIWKQ